MRIARNLVVVSVVVSLCLVTGLPLLLAQQRPETEPDAQSSLAKAAELAYESAVTNFQIGRVDVEDVYRWSKRWMEAEHSNSARDSHLERMKELHEKITQLHGQGVMGAEEDKLLTSNYYLMEARQSVASGR